MTVLGINVGKSRLAEVVNACRQLKLGLENPPHLDLLFGARMSECDPQRLEALHYDWASCCDRRMFLIVKPTDVPAILQLGSSPLAQMFDLVLLDQTTHDLTLAVEKVFPRAEHVAVNQVAVKSVDELGGDDGLPAILLDCHDEQGVFNVARVRAFMTAAAAEAVADDEGLVPVVAHAATDFGGE